ncbi:UNVERIFIED_CONTAM: hypothetical protein FKN15_022274 [Acipenser sinensis]
MLKIGCTRIFKSCKYITKILSRIQTDLHKIPTRNWQEPFQKVKTWAYRNFRKIKQTTFQTAFLIAQENLEPLQATQQPQPSFSNNSFAVLADNERLPQRPLPMRPNKPHTSNVTTYISEEITRISTNQSQPNSRQWSPLDQPTETNEDWLYIKAITYAAQLNTPTGPSEPTSDSNQTPPPNHHRNPKPSPNTNPTLTPTPIATLTTRLSPTPTPAAPPPLTLTHTAPLPRHYQRTDDSATVQQHCPGEPTRIPDHTQSQIQIESYPGAKFLHAANHLDKAKTDRGVTKVILSFGINNKDQKVKDS